MFDFLESARKHDAVSKDWIGGYMAVMNEYRKSKLPCHILVEGKNGLGMSATAMLLKKRLRI